MKPARRDREQSKGARVYRVWVPGFEREQEAMPERATSLEAAARDHYILCIAFGVEADVDVIVRTEGGVAFRYRFDANANQTELRCCDVCGCTDDDPCAEGDKLDSGNLCDACKARAAAGQRGMH